MSAPTLDLRAVQETLDWHDAPPKVGEVRYISFEYELTITQLRALLAMLRATLSTLEALKDEVGDYISGDEEQYPELTRLRHEADERLASVSDAEER